MKRLEALEELAAKHPGVEKVYALQAGREIRVIVKPGEVDDDTAVLLSFEIARDIEDHLEYPGQIKVTVIRESRAVEFAKSRPPVFSFLENWLEGDARVRSMRACPLAISR